MITPYANDLAHARYYAVDRDEDVSQVSGTGRIAYAIELADYDVGVLLVWDTKWTTVDWRPSMAVLEEIHGHNGSTRITPLTPAADQLDIDRALRLLDRVHTKANGALALAGLLR